ncbi:MAG: hypothetical protein ACYDAO_05960 [Thermoplasmataceae archaeon]
MLGIIELKPPHDIFLIESGRKFNAIIGSWALFKLKQFTGCKVQEKGKSKSYVNQEYISQKCCNHDFIGKTNSKGSIFYFLNRNLVLHSEFTALRNFRIEAKSQFFKLFPTSEQSCHPCSNNTYQLWWAS